MFIKLFSQLQLREFFSRVFDMKKIPKRIHFSTPMLDSSIPKDLEIKELFICIWPQQINIRERCDITIICRDHKAKALHIKSSSFLAGKKILLFDKKADFLKVKGEPLLNISKGGFFKCVSCEENADLFRGDYKKQQKFKEMLSKMELCDDKKLCEYLTQNFSEVSYKQSYSFAVYMRVDFVVHEGCYIINRQQLPNPHLPIYGFMAFIPTKIDASKGRTKVWDSKWITDLGKEEQIEVTEEYNEETFDRMLDVAITEFLTPLLKSSTSSSYIKDVLEKENLPNDSETCRIVLDKLLQFVITKGEDS